MSSDFARIFAISQAVHDKKEQAVSEVAEKAYAECISMCEKAAALGLFECEIASSFINTREEAAALVKRFDSNFKVSVSCPHDMQYHVRVNWG